MKTGLSLLSTRRPLNKDHIRLSNLVINRHLGESFVINDNNNIAFTMNALEADGLIIDIASDKVLLILKRNGDSLLAKEARCALQTGEDLIINRHIIIRLLRFDYRHGADVSIKAPRHIQILRSELVSRQKGMREKGRPRKKGGTSLTRLK